MGSIPGLGTSHMPQSNQACAPQPLNPWVASTEAQTPGACAPKQEKPPKGEACAPQLDSSPRSPQAEKTLGHNNEDPAQP